VIPSDSTQPYKFVLLEALSATGLRSIRYAKEIPLVKLGNLFYERSRRLSRARYIIANDLSPSATAAMKRNIELNGLGPIPEPSSGISKALSGMVRINEGDAWYVLCAN